MVHFVNVNDEYARDKRLKKADVLNLMRWQALQPHLPTITELQTAVFLHACNYSNEATKQCIDNHYTFKTHCPEFFAQRDPNSKEVQLALDTAAMVALPKPTPAGEVVLYGRLINCNPDAYNFCAQMKAFDMLGWLHAHEHGCEAGHIIVVDVEGATLTHVLKTSPLAIKKYLYYLQDALPCRLKSFHYVNGVPFMDKILALVKPFMKKELQENLHVHYGRNETLFPFVPQDCLPMECGGNGGSVLDMHRISRKNMESNSAFFLEQEKQLVDESMRPGKPKNSGDLFGVEGTFKKLEID